MCMALAANGTTVVAWKCTPGATSQQWTGYNDGTLRTAGQIAAKDLLPLTAESHRRAGPAGPTPAAFLR